MAPSGLRIVKTQIESRKALNFYGIPGMAVKSHACNYIPKMNQ